LKVRSMTCNQKILWRFIRVPKIYYC
jgi:hypothetical protein